MRGYAVVRSPPPRLIRPLTRPVGPPRLPPSGRGLPAYLTPSTPRRFAPQVFHLHDPNPADTLIVKEAKRGVSAGKAAKEGKNFRNYDFPEGVFPSSGVRVSGNPAVRVA